MGAQKIELQYHIEMQESLSNLKEVKTLLGTIRNIVETPMVLTVQNEIKGVQRIANLLKKTLQDIKAEADMVFSDLDKARGLDGADRKLRLLANAFDLPTEKANKLREAVEKAVSTKMKKPEGLDSLIKDCNKFIDNFNKGSLTKRQLVPETFLKKFEQIKRVTEIANGKAENYAKLHRITNFDMLTEGNKGAKAFFEVYSANANRVAKSNKEAAKDIEKTADKVNKETKDASKKIADDAKKTSENIYKGAEEAVTSLAKGINDGNKKISEALAKTGQQIEALNAVIGSIIEVERSNLNLSQRHVSVNKNEPLVVNGNIPPIIIDGENTAPSSSSGKVSYFNQAKKSGKSKSKSSPPSPPSDGEEPKYDEAREKNLQYEHKTRHTAEQINEAIIKQRNKKLEGLKKLREEYGKMATTLDEHNAKAKEEVNLISEIRDLDSQLIKLSDKNFNDKFKSLGTIGTAWSGNKPILNTSHFENSLAETIKKRREAETKEQAKQAKEQAKTQEEYSKRTAKLWAQEKFQQITAERKLEEQQNKRFNKYIKQLQSLYEHKLVAEDKFKEINLGNWNKYARKENEIHSNLRELGINPEEYGLSRMYSAEERAKHLKNTGLSEYDREIKRKERRAEDDSISHRSAMRQLFEQEDHRIARAKELNKLEQDYNTEIARGNQLMEYGAMITQKQYDAHKKLLEDTRTKHKNLGGDESKLAQSQILALGSSAAEVNKANAIKNAMSWQGMFFRGADEKVNYLTSSLNTLYTQLNRSPGNKGVKRYVELTEAELKKARKEAEAVQKALDRMNPSKLRSEMGRHFRYIGRAFGFYESYDMLNEAGRTIMNINESMANLRTVMPQLHYDKSEIQEAFKKRKPPKNPMTKKSAEAAMWEQQREIISIASQYGNKIEETIESARLWGRMYKEQEMVNLLTAQSAKLAVADNFSVEESTKAVEAAMFQFGMQAKTTAEALAYSNRIIDVYTKLSHNAGVTAQDLAAAVERSGSVAHQAGMSFEFLNALIAQATRSTALSGLTNTSPFMLETA